MKMRYLNLLLTLTLLTMLRHTYVFKIMLVNLQCQLKTTFQSIHETYNACKMSQKPKNIYTVYKKCNLV